MNLLLLFIIVFIILIIILLNIAYNKAFQEINKCFLKLKLKDCVYNSDIKTCVLISGQVRDNFYECLMSQKLFIFDPLNVDIFAVFSDDIENETKQKIIKLLKPKKILWIKDTKIINNKLSLPLSFYPMTHKILLCNNLKKIYEKENKIIYDINIRTRIDLIITSYIPEDIINNIRDNTIYYPSVCSFDIFSKAIYGIPDQFLLGNSYSMNIFSNIYNYVINKNNSDIYIAEIFLKYYLVKNNIKFIRINNFKFNIIRNLIGKNDIITTINDKNKNMKFAIHFLNIFNYLNNYYNYNNSNECHQITIA